MVRARSAVQSRPLAQITNKVYNLIIIIISKIMESIEKIDINKLRADIEGLYQRVAPKLNDLKRRSDLGEASNEELKIEPILNEGVNSLYQLMVEINKVDGLDFETVARIDFDYREINERLYDAGWLN